MRLIHKSVKPLQDDREVWEGKGNLCVCLCFLLGLHRQSGRPLITVVAAVHAHLASIWAHVALHALHSSLAGAQTRHLLAIISDRAHGIAAARCREGVEGRRKKKID